VSFGIVFAVAAATFAALGWTRTAEPVQRPAPSIRIVDVRPLHTSDAGLRDFVTHTFELHVAITGWRLLPYRPGATASDNRPGAGHWRLYLDGYSLGDNFGSSAVSYIGYLTPGTHWLAAELSNADSSSLQPAAWSEPIVLHVPRVLRCWQDGWRGSPELGTPRFRCNPHGTRR
jgi:hypothetical protein